LNFGQTFGVKMGEIFVNQMRKFLKETFENIRKRLKTIWKYSKIDTKRSKIFENIQKFCRPLRI